MGDAGRSGLEEREGQPGHDGSERQAPERAGCDAGFWSDFDVIACRDGKARRVESGSFPLVDGLPFLLADGRTVEGASRAATLKGIGNAIVPPLAAVFIQAFMEFMDATASEDTP